MIARFASLTLAGAAALTLWSTPASACDPVELPPRPGPLGLVGPYSDAPSAPADTAFLLRATDGPPAARVRVANDTADNSVVEAKLAFYSQASAAALYVLEAPLVIGHEYESVTAYDTVRFVATAATATPLPAAPAASILEVRDYDEGGCGSVSSCGGGTSYTFEGVASLGEGGGFYAIRYAATEAQARTVRPMAALSMYGMANDGPRSGWAAISRFDAQGRESERTVVPIVDENQEEGGCSAAPRSSGAQLYAWLAVAALIGRRLRLPRAAPNR